MRTHRANASHEHIVQPGMVYISNPTEVGTLYNKEELTDISATCYGGLYLFVDGARMAYGLTSQANDLNLQDYATLCDVFTWAVPSAVRCLAKLSSSQTTI